jgi:lipoprotein-anchoring transpeptidase ErfK/SrfK
MKAPSITNGTVMSTRQPWTARTDGGRADRAQRVAAALAVGVVLALTAGVASHLLTGVAAGVDGSTPPAAAPAPPPETIPTEPPRPGLPAPTDARDDGAVVPPLRTPASAPNAEPAVESPMAAEPAAPEPDDPPVAEPTPVADPAPAPVEEVAPAPAPDPVDLVAVQRRLQELGYLLGPADGVRGQQTVAAVMAFQRVNGLAVDGVVGPRTLAALEAPVTPQLRGGPATRIEVDLTRQLLHVVRDGARVVTLHVSSGNGEAYRGGTARARTPVGDFRVERRIHGERHAELGVLYDPLYFHRGYAIHGSNSVPNHPASHGCVRVTRADARWLIATVADGTPVQLHGGTHVFTP